MLRDRWVFKSIVSPFTLVDSSKFVLEIYCAGCNFHCKNCHNPELHDFFSPSAQWTTVNHFLDFLDSYINNNLIQEVFICGGEPLFNYNRIKFLSLLLKEIKKKRSDMKFVLFTGYDTFPDFAEPLLRYLDFVKLGKYIHTLPEKQITRTFKLASSNQKVFEVINGKLSTKEYKKEV